MASTQTNTLRLKGLSLILMLLVPPLLLYPGALHGNSTLHILGWIMLLAAMVIPLCVPK